MTLVNETLGFVAMPSAASISTTKKEYCLSKGFSCPIGKSSLYEKDFFEKAKIVRRYVTVKE